MNFSSLHLIYYSSTPLARTWYKLLVSSVQHSQCPSLWFPQGTICNKHEEFLEEGILADCSTNLPSSLECTTKGPPESPCGRIIMLMIFLLSSTNPPDRNLCCHFRSPHTWKSPGWPENIFQNVKLTDTTIFYILEKVTSCIKFQLAGQRICHYYYCTLTSCLPAARNMFLHFSFDTMGTVVWGTRF